MVPGWICSMCSKGNPLPRKRCRNCGRKKMEDAKHAQVRKGSGLRNRQQREVKSKSTKANKGVN